MLNIINSKRFGMKKLLSLFLSLLMVFTLVTPVFALETPLSTSGSQIPVVALFGDGEAIRDTEDNVVFKFSELLNIFSSDGEEEAEGDDSTMDAVISILQPFLIEGILQDEWDNYYAVLEKEIGDLFTEVRYDNNGECTNGTDISKTLRDQMAYNMTVDKKVNRGSYYVYDYQFWYDWRQDPLKTADEFHAYIEGIKEATGCEKVSVLARCLGTTVVMAYIAKYGTDSLHGVAFNGGVVEGAEIISETISGKFTIDGDGINRLLLDLNATGSANIDEFVNASIDLAERSGAIDALTGIARVTIYNKLVKGVTSALSLATFFTWPGYWACVSEEDYEDALLYVFGEENSEKRTEYAGLIEKIENYNTQVRSELDNLYDELEYNDVIIAVMAKYGFQIAPICESSDQIADQYATLEKASFGATVADSIYDTFSDEYIAQREAEGKGKYISPDKQVDASTCRFPDYTWFTKNISHSYWHNFETGLLFNIITADKQYTVDDFDCTQYVVHDYETGAVTAMTEENCHTEAWYDAVKDGKASNIFERVTAFFKSLFNWIKLAFAKIFA